MDAVARDAKSTALKWKVCASSLYITGWTRYRAFFSYAIFMHAFLQHTVIDLRDD